MKTYLLYIFTFFAIFGFKLGFVDFAVVIPAILLPFIMSSRKINVTTQRWANNVCFCLIVLSVILMCSQIINSNLIVIDNLRLARAFCVVPLIILAFRGISAELIYKLVFYTLLSHCVIIIIAANIYFINEITSMISGNDRFKEGRASGLLGGYDMAGLLSLFALCMLVFDIIKLKDGVKYFFGCLILICIFYTSRVTMAISLCIAFYWICRTINSNQFRWGYKVFFAAISFASIAFFSIKLLIILNVTFELGIDMFSSPDYVESVTKVHAAQNEDSFLWSNMFLMPKTIGGLFWGSGSDILESDVGYVKEIFRYGFLGLIVAVFVHYLVIIRPLRYFNTGISFKNIVLFHYIIFVLVIILNLKNNYFFTRGVWPLYIMFGIAVYNFADKNQVILHSENNK